MKLHSVSLIGLLITASAILSSCHNIMNKNYGALEMDSICLNETTHLFGDTAKPACNLTVNFSYVKQAERPELKDSLNRLFLATCLGENFQGTDPEQALRLYAREYAREYRQDLEPTYLEEKEEDNVGAWYSYYRNLTSNVQYYENEILVYRCRYEEYTGGAHGIYTTHFLNLNLKTMKPVHLNDLFTADANEALTDLLWNQLMADNRVASREELEDLGYTSTGELTPTENFFLSKEGITFYYNVYEIAPYVMGPIQISLPWEMVQHLRNHTEEPNIN